MSVFVIKNQHDLYLGKQQNWLSGKEKNAVYRADHHDEALNYLIEMNAKDISVRGEIIQTQLDEKKQPEIEVSQTGIDAEAAQLIAKSLETHER